MPWMLFSVFVVRVCVERGVRAEHGRRVCGVGAAQTVYVELLISGKYFQQAVGVVGSCVRRLRLVLLFFLFGLCGRDRVPSRPPRVLRLLRSQEPVLPQEPMSELQCPEGRCSRLLFSLPCR